MKHLSSAVPQFCLFFCLSVLNIFIAAAQQVPSPRKQPRSGALVVSISETSSSGMCYGYCITEVTTRRGKIQVVQHAFHEQKNAYPGKRKAKGRLTAQEWPDLAALATDPGLLSLPERIGCPGCVDQLVGGVEIKFSDGTKKTVEHNYGAGPIVLDKLEEKLDFFRTRVLPNDSVRP